MRFLLFLSLLIFCSACQYVEEPPNTKAEMKHLVLSDTVRWLRAEKELYACGWGGQEKSTIQMMALSFFYHKPVSSIEQGRDLLISAIQRFMGEIQKETRLHKYLEENPFPFGRIEIRIFIQDVNGSLFSREELTVLTFIDGVLNYKIDSPSKGLETIYRETYEEALAKWNSAK